MSQFLYQTATKEKFSVITIENKELLSNLAEKLDNLTKKLASTPPNNLILNLRLVENWDEPFIEQIAKAQGQFYEQNFSFVICGISKQLQDILDSTDYAELLNMTPTESEAWDIVQMEEIERELLDSDDMEFSLPNAD